MLSSLKLVDLIEQNAAAMAGSWADDVIKNPKTPYYHQKRREELIPQAVLFYTNFRQNIISKKPDEASQAFFRKYADKRYREKVPLHEAVYGLILMRRHIWLFAEFQAIFITSQEQRQAVDSLTRTILMFDYAMYHVTERYHELMEAEIGDRLSVFNLLRMEQTPRQRTIRGGIMALMLLGAVYLTYYSHAVLGTGVIFTHLFYVPIILAAIWWRKKGVLVAAGMAIFLVLSNMGWLKGAALNDDLIRGCMFIVIGLVVAFLNESVLKSELAFKETIGADKPHTHETLEAAQSA